MNIKYLLEARPRTDWTLFRLVWGEHAVIRRLF
jgi:hypothetical protein